MAYEFSQVEGDISSLSERDVSSIIPDGVSFSQFKEKLDSGEYVLLTDAPKQSAMVHDSVNKIWSVAPSTNTTLSPQAQSALSARANQSGNVATGASGSGSANDSSQAATTNIEDTYVPEPVKPDRSDVPPALKYEYCFEIAASDDTFRKAVGCTFQLAKTEQEGMIGQWQTKPTEHGTKYTAYAAFDEPKKLVAKISADTMGVSVPDHVVMKPEGSAVVREAFIPVTPSIQLGERLGLPTEGY
ncbi:S-type Pyocin domain-containing protein, partial [Salinivibrio sp. IB872]